MSVSPIGLHPLDDVERATLKACEATIEDHIGAWVNVTNAMLEVAERRLYRETHSTFEAYLTDRWGISRQQGHRLVLHGRVLRSPVGDRVRNERQARELAGLLDKPELLVAVVDRAEELQGDKRLTASALRQARIELLLPPEEAAKARQVYEVTEWTRERADEWTEHLDRNIRRLVDNLPPSEWAWGFGTWQDRPPRSSKAAQERFAGSFLTYAVFDMPLTDEVVAFLREASNAAGTSPVEPFTRRIDTLMRGQLGMQRLPAGSSVRVREFLTELSDGVTQVGAAILEAFTLRMQQVVLALNEPGQPLRTWTPEEVEEARAEWLAWLAEHPDRTLLTPGPLLDSAGQAMRKVGDVFDNISAQLEQQRAEKGREQ
jgi:hypothetical protein